MVRAAGVFAFVVALLFVGIGEAPAVPFNSGAGIGSCTAGGGGGGGTCVGGFVAITPVTGIWQPNNSGASSGAFWVSFANTGAGGAVLPNAPGTTHGQATEIFTVNIPAGFVSLSLIVWADDTAGVSTNGGTTYLTSDTPGAHAPNTVQAVNCQAGPLTCTAGGGAHFSIPLGGLATTLEFDTFQLGGGTFGLLYAGDLTPVPEPASLLLVGSVLAAAGFVSRKRLQKNLSLTS
jgi:PEP-CTERM motif